MKKLWKKIKQYRLESVFFSYMKIFGILTFIVVILYTILFFRFYQNNLNDNINTFSREIMTASSHAIDIVFDEAAQYSRQLVVNDHVRFFVQSPKTYLSGKLYIDNVRIAVDELYKITNYSDYITHVWLCSFNNNFVLSDVKGGKKEEFSDTLWMKKYNETKEEYFIIPDETKENVYVTRFLQDGGLFTMEIDIDKLWNDIKGKNYFSTLTISDKDDNICYSSDISYTGNNISDYFTDEINYNNIKNHKDIYIKIHDSDVIVSSPSNHGMIYTIYADSLSSIKKPMAGLLVLFLCVSVIILILAGLISILLAMRIYRSISDIGDIFKNSDENIKLKKNNEITAIYENAHIMFEEKRQNELELSRKREMLEKATNIALQAQISPHFIFNTLQAIVACISCELKEDNEAVKMVLLLADLLHITFDTKENVIPIQKEIEHAKKYLEIQNLKYGNLHTIVWSIDEDVKACKVLKLVLQPLLENSIEHGFESGDENDGILRKIEINIYIKNDILNIEVNDNGIGIAPVKLENIKKKMNSDEIAETRHIGISNVNQRVKLTFGNQYGISIESMLDKGTMVNVKMPVIRD